MTTRHRVLIGALGLVAAGFASAEELTVRAQMRSPAVDAVGQVAETAPGSAIDCETSAATGCVATYAKDTAVTLTASSVNNASFIAWGDGCAEQVTAPYTGLTCTVTMSASRTVNAYFRPAAYQLGAIIYPKATAQTPVPTYGGTLAAAATVPAMACAQGVYGAGVTFLAGCNVAAPAGASVDVVATPNAGSRVTGWVGCASVSADKLTCTVAMGGPKAVTAYFGATNMPVTAKVFGGGSVTASGADPMACTAAGGDCTSAVAPGGSITLTAVEPSGSKFVAWTGACTGTALTCDLTNVVSAQTAVATFKSTSCSACHGLPPATHAASYTDCSLCHPGYTSSTVDAAVHNNGRKEFDRSLKHAAIDDAALAGIGADGTKVTKLCLLCHPAQADAVLASNHFTWKSNSAMTGQTGVGKVNLVNNFCVATASNESRCNQCHPAYGTAPVKDPTTGALKVNTGSMTLWASNPGVDKTRIDCLICHTNIGTSNYVKSPANFGQPWPKTAATCTPACSAAQICSNVDSAGAPWTDGKNYCRAPTAAELNTVLTTAAKNLLAKPARSNCGFCHFNAGGGDNVKMGDLASTLASPTSGNVDVHMAATTTTPAGHGLTCVSCHKANADHKLPGAGLSIPVDTEGRFTCQTSTCHPVATFAHVTAENNRHMDWVACQTCHIPRFSKSGFTKMDWDWRVSADKQACQGVAGCVPFNSVSYPAGNAQAGTVSGIGGEAQDKTLTGWDDPADATHKLAYVYDWKKGRSRVEKNIVPVYRWMSPTGFTGTHATTDNSGFTVAGDEANPVTLSGLNGGRTFAAGKKIYPFKRMTGRTPALADDSAMLVPHVFGTDSLWQNDLRGYPVVNNNLGGSVPWSEGAVDAIWKGVLNYGAAVGGQLGAPVAKVAAAGMVRDAGNVVTVTTANALPDPLPATLYLVGQEAAFPTGVKTVTRVDANHFTYTEAIPYTTNPSAVPAITLPALPATSTKFVTFFKELPAWKWVNTEMYINLNHEVAPKASALGCADCHIGGTRMAELYGCSDPASCPVVP